MGPRLIATSSRKSVESAAKLIVWVCAPGSASVNTKIMENVEKKYFC